MYNEKHKFVQGSLLTTFIHLYIVIPNKYNNKKLKKKKRKNFNDKQT